VTVLISGGSVQLRELRERDTTALHAVYGNPDVCQHMSFTPRTIAQCEAVIASAGRDASADPRRVYMLAIADPLSGELIGACRLSLEEWEAGQVGLALRPDRWGHGAGTETLRLLFRFGFGQLGLHRIWGARSPKNEASARLMLAAGMTEQGIIRSHVMRHGIWEDSVTYSIIEDEYKDGS
jgi:RimJ/RimL family protein N-acetyltransferase